MATHFHGRRLAEPGTPVGYAELIERYGLAVPLPPVLAVISPRHRRRSYPDLEVFTPRHCPADTLAAQLLFALKWEGLNLSVLAALFKIIAAEEIATVVRSTPTGAFARRLWFLYEWLTGITLDVPDAGRLTLVPVLDAQHQVALAEGVPSPRHKVLDNLPGTRDFCPLVRWTPTLRAAAARELDLEARDTIGRTRRDLVTRAAAFLLLSDSKSSFAIEGEHPTSDRASRWARAISEAGAHPLSLDELERLQRIVIGDDRFVQLGLRTEGGFVGMCDRHTHEPVPEHVSARPQDLRSLLAGVMAYDTRVLERQCDPLATAAAIAFGFVYIHPFEDGNGRIHRWLMHHVLARAGYNPPGVVFPISAAILARLDEYKSVLESHSSTLLPFIEWRATADGNVDVRNDTADYYRFFDATRHAEFLYACVEQTVHEDLPAEVRFLEAFDAFATAVKAVVEMPDREIDRVRGFVAQGGGRFSKRAREREFKSLTDDEVARIEALFAEHFDIESPPR